MYKMSQVVYKLGNGAVVDTLEEAKKSGMNYTIEYIPSYEEYPIESLKRLTSRKKVY